MGTFGGHLVSDESSHTTFGALSVSAAAVGKFGGCQKYVTLTELQRSECVRRVE